MLIIWSYTISKLVRFTEFLQVRENWKKSGNLSGQGKGQGKIVFFGKVRENEKLVPLDVRSVG